MAIAQTELLPASAGVFLGQENDVENVPQSLSLVDFLPDQTRIKELSDLIRKDGVKGQPRTSAELGTVLGGLKEKLQTQDGWLVLVIPLPSNQFGTCYQYEDLITDYGIDYKDRRSDEIALVIPAAGITAVEANPQIYEAGKDVLPVLWLRIQTSKDEPMTVAKGPAKTEGTLSSGRWFEVPIEITPMALLKDSTKLA